MPYAVALDDILSVLPEGQGLKIPSVGDVPSTLLALMIQLDRSLEKIFEFTRPIEVVAADEADQVPFDFADLASIIEQFREIVSGRSRASVAELSAALGRKIRGARGTLLSIRPIQSRRPPTR